MAEDSSLVTKRRDYSNIAVLQDPGVLEDFLDEPLTFIAETITGALGVGRTGMQVAGGRIVQAILKGKLFEQWAAEFKMLREKGRIPDDFAEKKFGFQTWVELMKIIDEESPDSDRLEALKAMFFAVNKTNATDGERIAAYHLWQVAKSLNSGELFLLKLAYESRETYEKSDAKVGRYDSWRSAMAHKAGHGITGLIDIHEKKPTELGLLNPQVNVMDGIAINPKSGRLTDFGIRFCENIETYQIEMREMLEA